MNTRTATGWRIMSKRKTKRFITLKPLPSPYEREVLTILIEECAEVQQRATKLLRFGRDEVQPKQHLSNMQRLSAEIGDLNAIVRVAHECGLVSAIIMRSQEPIKRRKLKIFMQTTKPQHPSKP